MKAIFKYALTSWGGGSQILMLPKGAQILDVQLQYDKPQLWALVDPEQSILERREIATMLTGHGHACANPMKHLATLQLDGGNYVFHVFEVVPMMASQSVDEKVGRAAKEAAKAIAALAISCGVDPEYDPWVEGLAKFGINSQDLP